MKRRHRILLALALVSSSAMLRFHQLSTWPFAGDELATITEARSLFEDSTVDAESDTYRLPRAIPLSYLVHYAGYRTFGESEFASRVPQAVLGSLSVGLVYWCLSATAGPLTGLATALLVLLWPEHLFHSQENRFYMIAAFTAFVTLLLGERYACRRRPALLLATYAVGLGTILMHTVTALLLPIVTLGLVAAARAERRPLPRQAWWVVLAAHVIALAILAWYVAPLLAGWNRDAPWRYSLPHAVLASANRIGWPVAIIAFVGSVLALASREASDRYWLAAGAGFAAAVLVLPTLVVYHPEYVFPLSLAPLVLAGRAIAVIDERLRPLSRHGAFAWLILFPFVQLPSVASHFVDGSRVDLRDAAAYVSARWTPQAAVTGQFMDTLRYYAPDIRRAVPLDDQDPVRQLEGLMTGTPAPRPLWVVLQSGRAGLDARLQDWLNDRCRHRHAVRKPRFDYYEYRVDVFVCAGRTD